MQLMDPIFELMAPARRAGGFRWQQQWGCRFKTSKIGWCLRNFRDTSQFFFNGSNWYFPSIFPKNKGLGTSGCLGFQVVMSIFLDSMVSLLRRSFVCFFRKNLRTERESAKIPQTVGVGEEFFFSGVERFLKLYKLYNLNIHFFKKATTITWGQEKKHTSLFSHTNQKHQNEKKIMG